MRDPNCTIASKIFYVDEDNSQLTVTWGLKMKRLGEQQNHYLIILFVGLGGGFALTPLLVSSIPLMQSLNTPDERTFWRVLVLTTSSGLLFIPALLAFAITGGKGTSILTQLVVGFVMATLTPYTLDVLFSCLLAGCLAELAIGLSTRYRAATYRSMIGAGALIGGLAAIGSAIGHGMLGLNGLQSLVIGGSTIVATSLLAGCLKAVSVAISRLLQTLEVQGGSNFNR